MTDIMLRNADHFWMQLDLDQLHNLPIEKWRKICKNILTLEINEASRLRILHWFPAAISNAEEDWILADKREAALHMDLKGRDKTGKAIAREHNRDLARETSKAKTRYDKLRARYEAFKQINNFMED